MAYGNPVAVIADAPGANPVEAPGDSVISANVATEVEEDQQASESIFEDRITDLRVASRITAKQLLNLSGGVWEKYLAGGEDINRVDAADPLLIVKNKDVQFFDTAAQQQLFLREHYAVQYVDALKAGSAAEKVIVPKRQSAMVSSMLGGLHWRLCTRIWAMAAVASRRISMYSQDIELIRSQLAPLAASADSSAGSASTAGPDESASTYVPVNHAPRDVGWITVPIDYGGAGGDLVSSARPSVARRSVAGASAIVGSRPRQTLRGRGVAKPLLASQSVKRVGHSLSSITPSSTRVSTAITLTAVPVIVPGASTPIDSSGVAVVGPRPDLQLGTSVLSKYAANSPANQGIGLIAPPIQTVLPVGTPSPYIIRGFIQFPDGFYFGNYSYGERGSMKLEFLAGTYTLVATKANIVVKIGGNSTAMYATDGTNRVWLADGTRAVYATAGRIEANAAGGYWCDGYAGQSLTHWFKGGMMYGDDIVEILDSERQETDHILVRR